MSTDLTRLVYYSRNRLNPGDSAPPAELAAILSASRRNNEKVGVTGALLFNAGCFGQVLEGPRDAVEEVFERIQQDDRHGEVSLLAFAPVPSRAFPNWSMGFVGASETEGSRYSHIGRESGFDPSRMSGDALFEALHRLAIEEEELAA